MHLDDKDSRTITMCGMAAGFAALGGRVRVAGRTLYAEPGGTLQGTMLEAPDLRGGAALVIAALAAQGSSRITHTEFIDRGYADFAQKLTALGGQIARETPRGADCPKKELQKRKFDLHSRQKDDTIQLYKCRLIFLCVLHSSTIKSGWRTKLWH